MDYFRLILVLHVFFSFILWFKKYATKENLFFGFDERSLFYIRDCTGKFFYILLYYYC